MVLVPQVGHQGVGETPQHPPSTLPLGSWPAIWPRAWVHLEVAVCWGYNHLCPPGGWRGGRGSVVNLRLVN